MVARCWALSYEIGGQRCEICGARAEVLRSEIAFNMEFDFPYFDKEMTARIVYIISCYFSAFWIIWTSYSECEFADSKSSSPISRFIFEESV